MEAPPLSVLRLAGYALAHAAWSVSDTTDDELLCPLALVEQGGRRTLLRFEADTQEEAVATGKATMQETTDRAEPWAFAREGLLRSSQPDVAPLDGLVLEFWAPPMAAPIALLQPFARATDRDGFRLLSRPLIAENGRAVEVGSAEAIWAGIQQGIQEHQAVAPLWPTWLAYQ